MQLWVWRWKLRVEELYFPVPGSHWQHEMRWLLGLPASPGAFSISLQWFWGGICIGSATPSETPWSDALRHQMLSLPRYWHQHCGCLLLFGSEFLNSATKAVLILFMWEGVCWRRGEFVCKGILGLSLNWWLSRQVNSSITPEAASYLLLEWGLFSFCIAIF